MEEICDKCKQMARDFYTVLEDGKTLCRKCWIEMLPENDVDAEAKPLKDHGEQ